MSYIYIIDSITYIQLNAVLSDHLLMNSGYTPTNSWIDHIGTYLTVPVHVIYYV